MARRLFSITIIYLITIAAYSQNTWVKIYGNGESDEGLDVQQTADGGYIIIGKTYSLSTGSADDIYMVKVNSIGNIIFSKTWGGLEDDKGRCVQQTSDYGYMIIGSTRSFGAGYEDLYLIKTDENGDTLWTRTYGGELSETGYSGQQTIDGGYIITGYTMGGGILIKTNSLGDTLWTRMFIEEVLDHSYDIQQTNDKGYILIGKAGGLAALVKTDSLGQLLWARYFGAKRLDRGYSVDQTLDGGYVITGIQYIPGGSESESCVFLIKTDASGDTLWTRKLGDNHSAGNCVRKTVDGGYVITGYEDMDYISLIKTDALGNPVWDRKFDYGEGQAVRQTRDGGYIVTGSQNYDLFLMKTDDAGNVTGIEDKKSSNQKLIYAFNLYQNYPNPFNESTQIVYQISETVPVKIMLYDLLGRQVRTLVNRPLNAGIHEIQWNGKDKSGHSLPSGIYFCQLLAGDKRQTIKVLMAK